MTTETSPSNYKQPARLLIMVLVAFAAIAGGGTTQASAAATNRVGEGAPAGVAVAMVKLYNTAGASNVGTPSNNGGGKTAHRWGSGWIQDFAGGPYGQSAIMVADGGNAAIVRNGMWWAYAAIYGGAPGYLGYPTGNEQPYNGGARQSFAGGALEWHQGMDHARPPAIFFHGDKVAPCTGNGCGQNEASAVAAAPSLPMSGNKVDWRASDGNQWGSYPFVIGYSRGRNAAAKYVQAHQRDVHRVVLLDPSGANDTGFDFTAWLNSDSRNTLLMITTSVTTADQAASFVRSHPRFKQCKAVTNDHLAIPRLYLQAIADPRYNPC